MQKLKKKKALSLCMYLSMYKVWKVFKNFAGWFRQGYTSYLWRFFISYSTITILVYCSQKVISNLNGFLKIYALCISGKATFFWQISIFHRYFKKSVKYQAAWPENGQISAQNTEQPKFEVVCTNHNSHKIAYFDYKYLHFYLKKSNETYT